MLRRENSLKQCLRWRAGSNRNHRRIRRQLLQRRPLQPKLSRVTVEIVTPIPISGMKEPPREVASANRDQTVHVITLGMIRDILDPEAGLERKTQKEEENTVPLDPEKVNRKADSILREGRILLINLGPVLEVRVKAVTHQTVDNTSNTGQSTTVVTKNLEAVDHLSVMEAAGTSPSHMKQIAIINVTGVGVKSLRSTTEVLGEWPLSPKMPSVPRPPVHEMFQILR
mmetsp:Transcript_24289/g.40264  ORF Transcript_24289/g.40264 Transcript_24289/m.40264 type:complete len:227 (-) Transcript_24289:809-1489(-)